MLEITLTPFIFYCGKSNLLLNCCELAAMFAIKAFVAKCVLFIKSPPFAASIVFLSIVNVLYKSIELEVAY